MRTGIPIARPGQRIGLLGGSFDPAHDGHVLISETALRRLRLDRVWWLVSPGNPLKSRKPEPLAARMERARSLVVDPRIVVTAIEDQLSVRKTADTIQALKQLYPGVRFVWLMGSDNMVQFHRWDRWRSIASAVPMAVMARPGSVLAARHSVSARILSAQRLPEAMAPVLAGRRPPAWTFLNLPMSALSSTQMRGGEHDL